MVEIVNYDSVFSRISKHPRYLSDWADNIIKIRIDDVNEDLNRIYTFNLNDIYLPPNYPRGPFKTAQPLVNFPNWIDLIKVEINNALLSCTSHYRDRVLARTNKLIKLLAWSVKNGIYSLSKLTENDFKELALSLSKKSWMVLLDVDDCLFNLLICISNNIELLNKLVDTQSKQGSIDFQLLNKLTGLPFSTANTPKYFYAELYKRAGIALNPKGIEDYSEPFSKKSLSEVFFGINELCRNPDGIDKPAFLPYPKASSLAKNIAKSGPGRTKNLSIDEAVALLSLSLKYIYEYSDGIIFLGQTLKTLYSKANTSKKRENLVNSFGELFIAFSEKHRFPVSTIKGINQRQKGRNKRLQGNHDNVLSYMDLIHNLQTACMIICGINHARRKNEILGEGHRPYGLYYGCIKDATSQFSNASIDIYIEKTIKDWAVLPCNKLVSDAVHTLERIYEIFNSGGESNKTRQDKLFRFKYFNYRDFGDWMSYNFYNHSKSFLIEANVSDDCINSKTHIFRRFFSLIYYYRYDNPTLIALKNHLAHHSIQMTKVYVTDASMRQDADSIDKLYKKESLDFIPDHHDTGSEYIKQKIKQVINGEPTGGGLSKTIHALYKHLLKRVQFRVSDESEQCDEIFNELDVKGYQAATYNHGSCMISSKCNQKKANCYDAKIMSALTEKACLEVCQSCRYFFDNENYLQSLEDEVMSLKNQSKNFSLSTAERLAYSDTYKNLSSLIKLERTIQKTNAEKILALKLTASLVWGVNDNVKLKIAQYEKARVYNSEKSSA